MDAKPRLVDSHAHLDMPDFDPDRAATVRRAFDAGVVAILCPTDLTRPASFLAIAALEGEFPTVLAAAASTLIRPKTSRRPISASSKVWPPGTLSGQVGEIGLDYHYDFSPAEVQRQKRCAASWLWRPRPACRSSYTAVSPGANIIAAVDAERFRRGHPALFHGGLGNGPGHARPRLFRLILGHSDLPQVGRPARGRLAGPPRSSPRRDRLPLSGPRALPGVRAEERACLRPRKRPASWPGSGACPRRPGRSDDPEFCRILPV